MRDDGLCPDCDSPVPDDAYDCPTCGMPLDRVKPAEVWTPKGRGERTAILPCEHCGIPIEADSWWCSHCRTMQSHYGQRRKPPISASSPGMRVMTRNMESCGGCGAVFLALAVAVFIAVRSAR